MEIDKSTNDHDKEVNEQTLAGKDEAPSQKGKSKAKGKGKSMDKGKANDDLFKNQEEDDDLWNENDDRWKEIESDDDGKEIPQMSLNTRVFWYESTRKRF